ncbi:SDR family NAD(P)-dependent oxidoreductase [Streptomyces sp. NPDC058701]|uniref:SDR family NAD(P)-dependent oxidoreductase n=1 Tax=Streptomyces sp. NPDC058701 TaxID=3346608 RepID=UPI00365F566B
MTRSVVITGGTRGIGRGLARAFLDRGCKVALCGRDAAGVEAALRELQGGSNAIGRVTDVTDRAQVAALWTAAAEAFGSVDIWINNAGATTARKPLWGLDAGDADSVLAANLGGVVNGSAVAAKGFLVQGHGRLWNMEGFGSDGRVMPGLSVYGSSKRAVTYLTAGLAADLEAERAGGAPDVRAALLSPGIVVTGLLLHDYTPSEYAKVRKVLNILADRVETVAPWLADQVLADRTSNGGRVAWLTRRKAAARFATAGFRKRSVLPDHLPDGPDGPDGPGAAGAAGGPGRGAAS